jgi:hypothetical protein
LTTRVATAHLRPCPACSRHARVSEDACPFCGAPLDEAFRQVPRLRRPRAALMSFGAGVAGLTPGCTLFPKDRSEGTVAPVDASFSAPDGEGIIIGVGGGTGVFAADAASLVAPYGIAPQAQCTTVQDCQDLITPIEAVCCVQEQCLFGTGATGVSCLDPQVQTIQASNYDQSCDADTDCIAVAEGNFCVPGAANCPSAAISKSAQPRYQSDVANTNAAFCSAPSSCDASSCGTSMGPSCVKGTCELTCPPGGAGTDGGYPGGDEEDAGG